MIPSEYVPVALSIYEHNRTASSLQENYAWVMCQVVEEHETRHGAAMSAAPQELIDEKEKKVEGEKEEGKGEEGEEEGTMKGEGKQENSFIEELAPGTAQVALPWVTLPTEP